MGKRRKNITPSAPPPEIKPWKHWVTLLVGAVLASAGTLVAAHYEINRSIEMDYKGIRIQGSAVTFPGGGYRISYVHPSGIHYGMLYKKPISMGGKDQVNLDMVYLPDEPQKFQPAGLSYIPGGISLALFGTGMACILRARRRLTMAFRARPDTKNPDSNRTSK